MRDNRQSGRVSIWSILNKYWNWFVWALIIFLIVWTSVFTASYDFTRDLGDGNRVDVAPFKPDSEATIALVFVKDYASYTIPVLMIVAIGFALLMDGKESLTMTITRWLRQKVEEEQAEEYKAQGMKEMYKAWSKWDSRRREAERNNRPFDEPPPPPPSTF